MFTNFYYIQAILVSQCLKYDEFLCHLGENKDFIRLLNKQMRRKQLFPFFESNSIEVGSRAQQEMAGFLCNAQVLWAVLSNRLELGQVLTGAPTATPTVVWAGEFPPGPQ